MSKKMAKIQAMLDAFESQHGSVSVSEVETLNWGCTAGCAGDCQGNCNATCASSCYNRCRSTYAS